jgi:hypothetical protein
MLKKFHLHDSLVLGHGHQVEFLPSNDNILINFFVRAFRQICKDKLLMIFMFSLQLGLEPGHLGRQFIHDPVHTAVDVIGLFLCTENRTPGIDGRLYLLTSFFHGQRNVGDNVF